MNRGIQFDIESHLSRSRARDGGAGAGGVTEHFSISLSLTPFSHIKPYIQKTFNSQFRGIQHVEEVNIEQKMIELHY